MVSQNFRSLTEFHRISTNLKEIRSVSPNFTEWLCLCVSENPHSSFWQTKWTCRPITHYGKLVRIGQWPGLGEGFTLSSASSWRLLNRVGAQVDYTIFNLEHFNKANWLPTAWELATISFQRRNCQGSSSEELQTQNFRLRTSGSELQTRDFRRSRKRRGTLLEERCWTLAMVSYGTPVESAVELLAGGLIHEESEDCFVIYAIYKLIRLTRDLAGYRCGFHGRPSDGDSQFARLGALER